MDSDPNAVISLPLLSQQCAVLVCSIFRDGLRGRRVDEVHSPAMDSLCICGQRSVVVARDSEGIEVLRQLGHTVLHQGFVARLRFGTDG